MMDLQISQDGFFLGPILDSPASRLEFPGTHCNLNSVAIVFELNIDPWRRFLNTHAVGEQMQISKSKRPTRRRPIRSPTAPWHHAALLLLLLPQPAWDCDCDAPQDRTLLRRRSPAEAEGPWYNQAAQVQQQTAGARPSATTHARASTASSRTSGGQPARRPPPATPLLADPSSSAPAATGRGAAAPGPELSQAPPAQGRATPTLTPAIAPAPPPRFRPRPASLSSCSAAASPARSRARLELDPLAVAPPLLFLMESLLENNSRRLGCGGALGELPTRRSALPPPPPPPSMEDRWWRRCTS
ncbi:actin cytoskeleton-regulatory complex protein PAN1-like [Panicum virgatum]|uniref:actin cytoskeleton-regulatory complex protein PAN1-like n=1 Tax=Panicum virgatum TaxID=38727 RepID=UPI0019D60547|nr:actin cytoskeleton-regulatory complex protein PAN1-like [Panicum virgatum]